MYWLQEHTHHASDRRDAAVVSNEPKRRTNSMHADTSPPVTSLANELPTSPTDVNAAEICVKKEPTSEEYTSSSSPSCKTLLAKNESSKCRSDELKRRLTLPLKVGNSATNSSKWTSLSSGEDARDDLKLTAYDVIAGVISTPLIKPLEPEADNGTSSPLKLTGNKLPTSSTTPTATPTTISAATPELSKNKEQHSLVQDLDEFSKVMHQVTQEQRAKERRDSLASELETYPCHSRDPCLLSPPPYISTGPIENTTFYRQKYPPIQTVPPSQSQDRCFHQSSANVMESKPRMLLPSPTRCVLNEAQPPLLSNTKVPQQTPTTPLEHFPSFPSPPGTHLPHPTSQSPAQGCPPHSSPSISYPYAGHDPMHHVSSTGNENWQLQQSVMHPSVVPQQTQGSQQLILQQQQRSAMLQQPHTSQGSLKETILAHVSSRIVAIAGQKRPLQDLTGSPIPPPKMKAAMLGHSTTSGPLHQYHAPAINHHMSPLYEGSLPPSSVTFPHQSL